jgi:hypothetical protein
MLTQYQTMTRRLLNDQTFARINDFDLRDYINVARGQIAGQSECFPAIGELITTPGTTGYGFTAIQLSAADAPLVQGILKIRMINLVTATGQQRLVMRDWPWFNNYIVAKPTETIGPPKFWTQYRQGSAGVFFINIPDQVYELSIDAVCYPIDLIDDTTAEGIPPLWTDAVPFFAAYYALMPSPQQDAAERMFQRFQEFMGRARMAVTPGVLPGSYPQGPDPMLPNRLGVHPAQQRGAPTAQGA